jgi:hypothetical protein
VPAFPAWLSGIVLVDGFGPKPIVFMGGTPIIRDATGNWPVIPTPYSLTGWAVNTWMGPKAVLRIA